MKKIKKDNVYLLVSLLLPMVKIWSRTLRIKRKNYKTFLELRQRGRGVLYAVWHDELFVPICAHRNEGVVVLVSESRDGEIISRILEGMGFGTIRGSSSRGGVRALKRLVKLIIEEKKEIAVTVDGPRGPRHRVKEGIIYLALKSGVPILPIRVEAPCKKVFKKSWDRFQLPIPGSRCKMIYGSPYYCSSRRITSSVVEEKRKELEHRMNNLL